MIRYIKRKIQEHRESVALARQMTEALIDNTLIYRMWADEFGTPFDKAVMQLHYAVESFGETVERFTKQ